MIEISMEEAKALYENLRAIFEKKSDPPVKKDLQNSIRLANPLVILHEILWTRPSVSDPFKPDQPIWPNKPFGPDKPFYTWCMTTIQGTPNE